MTTTPPLPHPCPTPPSAAVFAITIAVLLLLLQIWEGPQGEVHSPFLQDTQQRRCLPQVIPPPLVKNGVGKRWWYRHCFLRRNYSILHLPLRQQQSKNKVIAWRNDSAKFKENSPPAARCGAEWCSTAWILSWRWINGRWGGSRCLWVGGLGREARS